VGEKSEGSGTLEERNNSFFIAPECCLVGCHEVGKPACHHYKRNVTTSGDERTAKPDFLLVHATGPMFV
jgi:hypothetical protein